MMVVKEKRPVALANNQAQTENRTKHSFGGERLEKQTEVVWVNGEPKNATVEQ